MGVTANAGSDVTGTAQTSILIQRTGARLAAGRTHEGVIKRAGGVTNETSIDDMTAAEFRRIALSFPEAIEGSHMGHADFRVGGRIFATLGYPSDGFGVVMLSPQDQDLIVRDYPKAFAPAAGKWGASGSTTVLLRVAGKRAVTIALEAAWRKRARKRLASTYDA
jgi:hypothetical protein